MPNTHVKFTADTALNGVLLAQSLENSEAPADDSDVWLPKTITVKTSMTGEAAVYFKAPHRGYTSQSHAISAIVIGKKIATAKKFTSTITLPLGDADGDGMPDAWETKAAADGVPAHGLNKTQSLDAEVGPQHFGYHRDTHLRRLPQLMQTVLNSLYEPSGALVEYPLSASTGSFSVLTVTSSTVASARNTILARVDPDHDGISNLRENINDTHPRLADNSLTGSRDSDKDGMPNSWEVLHQLNILNPADSGSRSHLTAAIAAKILEPNGDVKYYNKTYSSSSGYTQAEWDTMNRIDPDGDGFTNLAEYIGGTNPRIYNDSDRDLAQIAIVSGNAQSALPWQKLPLPLTIQTFKTQGYNDDGPPINIPLERQSVTFTTDENMTLGYGDLQRFKTISATTDAAGKVAITVYLPGRAGEHQIRARLSNGREVSFSITVQAEEPLLDFEQGTVLPWGVINFRYPNLIDTLQLSLINAPPTGGNPTFKLSPGSRMPRGLQLSSAGQITGTPIGPQMGGHNFTVYAEIGNRKVTKTFKIRIKSSANPPWNGGDNPDPEEPDEPNPAFKLKWITKPDNTSGFHIIEAEWSETYHYNHEGERYASNHLASFTHYPNGYEQVKITDKTNKKPSMEEMIGMMAMPNLDGWNYKLDLTDIYAQTLGGTSIEKGRDDRDKNFINKRKKSWWNYPRRLVAVDAETENLYVTLPQGAEVPFILKKSVKTKDGATPVVTFEPITIRIPEGESFADLSQEVTDKLKFKDSDEDYYQEWYDLLHVEVYSDINNDGELNSEDSGLTQKAYLSSTEQDKGTEFMFADDDLSNGAWDQGDEDAPSGSDDDDAEEIHLEIGPLETDYRVWLEHPSMAGLKFYRDKACTDEFQISSSQPFVIGGPINWLTDNKVYIRAETVEFPRNHPQIEGDLKLMIRPPGTSSSSALAAKMKLTVVKELGAEKHHVAAIDYIFENNAHQMNRKMKPDLEDNKSTYAVMLESKLEPVGINAFPDDYDSIYRVTEPGAMWETCSVVVNGPYGGPTNTSTGFYDKHSGELYFNGIWDTSCSEPETFAPRQYYFCSKATPSQLEFGAGSPPLDAWNGTGGLSATPVNTAKNWAAIGRAKLKQGNILIVGAGQSGDLSVFHSSMSKGSLSHDYRELDGGGSNALSVLMPDNKHKVVNAGNRHVDYYPNPNQAFGSCIKVYIGFFTETPRL